MAGRLALLLLIATGCADTMEPHYLQQGEDPSAAIEELGYLYVEDTNIQPRGETHCSAEVVVMKDASDHSTAVHEYIHVQQNIELGCKRSGDADREWQAYLAIYIFEGCNDFRNGHWIELGVPAEELTSEHCR
jgi:hypothetical protein